MIRIMLVLLFLTTPLFAADKPIRVSNDFEAWEWKPITDSIRREGRRRIIEGRGLGFDYRGPLYRGPTGFIRPAGTMMEGKGAFRGKSVLLADCQVGLHGRYSRKIRTKSEYRFSLALRGEGKFQFRAWVQGIDVKDGGRSWLGFPNLIEIQATKEWKVHEGTFKLPPFVNPKFHLPHAVSAAIVIDKGDRIFLDDFSFEEK